LNCILLLCFRFVGFAASSVEMRRTGKCVALLLEALNVLWIRRMEVFPSPRFLIIFCLMLT
jgi:hypothetical protein